MVAFLMLCFLCCMWSVALSKAGKVHPARTTLTAGYILALGLGPIRLRLGY